MLAAAALACSAAPAPPSRPAAAAAAEVREHPHREAYFGDLHIHSRWSFDAYSSQVQVGPEQAYRYARGEAIEHISGQPIRMKGPPLDFMALTEHGTYMGVSASLDDPDHPLQRVALVRDLKSDDPVVRGAALGSFLRSLASGLAIPELVTDEVVEPTWRRIVELADRHYAPGTFTSFVAYEYTSMPDGQNLHRNVIFRGSNVPRRPFTSVDSQNPEALWAWMDRARAAGDDLLAIPHNANGSNGLMYRRVNHAGRPLDAAQAALRLRNEPVSEVFQIKGQSETHPALSPDDPWAGFEVVDKILGRPQERSEPAGSYTRHAQRTGLELQAAQGFNPYRFGVVSSSDGHNASSPTEEDNYTGKIGVMDGTPEARLGSAPFGTDQLDAPANFTRLWGAAGLAGVWARANTREAIFDAMRAGETFATSGPRIRVRLFAGSKLSPADAGPELIERGYARGVPMGGQLTAAPGASSPGFLIGVMRDPLEAPLERVQIIKGWVGPDGRSREKVFDVACGDGRAPDARTHRCAWSGAPPDLSDCSVDAAQGRSQILAGWRDPEFDAAEHAFYYVRALQVPTCRWSTWDSIRHDLPLPDDVPATLQERAISSPIWVIPAG